MSLRPTILVVEDDFLIRTCLTEFLEDHDMRVLAAETCKAALHLILSDEPFAVMIMDISLPDGSGIGLGQKTRLLRPRLPIIYATGHGLKLEHPSLLDRVVIKPYQLDTVLSVVQELMLAS